MKMLEEMVFIGEINLQIKFAFRAFERLQSESTDGNSDQIEIWSSIQSFLIATANVSKILWPHSKYKVRGERLRKLLNIDKNDPLSNRKFRNHFEHYDERIGTWFENQSSAVYQDLAMNPSMPSYFGTKFNSSHRGYNSFNNTLIFRGESLDLNPILKSLANISNNCSPYVLL